MLDPQDEGLDDMFMRLLPDWDCDCVVEVSVACLDEGDVEIPTGIDSHEIPLAKPDWLPVDLGLDDIYGRYQSDNNGC